ncbi:MAG: PucR family transcriptional regulator, partial [Thermocrispum sp.]
MTSLRRVVDRVGPTLLRVVGLPDADRGVADVVIAERGPHPHVGNGDLVLAVGTDEPAEIVDLLRQCAERGAAALLLKPPLSRRATVRKAAEAAGIGLVEVAAKASWAQLVWLLRTVLDALVEESDDAGAGGAEADLF